MRLLPIVLCVMIVAGAGCAGDGEAAYGYPDDPPADEECVYPTRVDPAIPKCLVSSHPPDLEVANYHNESHQLSVEVTFESGETLYSDTLSMAAKNTSYVEEDVFDEPGNYTISATRNGSETVVETWSLPERYVGDGDAAWRVGISHSGDLFNQRVSHQ